ncbi:MAG: NAD(+) synthase, partial [Dehalococcoidales bacterium]|nr:NAD(+) synthase [Dehalococcoidales bacterium]
MPEKLYLSKDLGFLRLGAAVPELHVANVDFNVAHIIQKIKEARNEGVQVLAFPEMSITGYTIGDLVQQQALLLKAGEGLDKIREESNGSSMIVIVGLPLEVNQKIFNCAAVVNNGHILGIIPKTLLPTYKEFYEDRWFTSSLDADCDSVEILGECVPFGTDILFKLRGIPAGLLGVEICEDLWVPLSPHVHQALSGATILVNPSASNEFLGKADWRRVMVSSESGRCVAAYCYVSSGIGESSNDLVYGGQTLIAENGTVLGESERLSANPQLIITDIDLERLVHDRRVVSSFHESSRQQSAFRIIETDTGDPMVERLYRRLESHPFIPADPAERANRCREIFSMQVASLTKKLSGSGMSHLVLGVSGGLDSTLSLLVAVKTMDFLGLPRQNVHACSLPAFGTTPRTKTNARKLSQALGVSFEQVDIRKSCRSHLKDLKHNGDGDIVF